ncbi:hypothetical protein GGF46_003579, partial [Coemansia sp. RSA 552]
MAHSDHPCPDDLPPADLLSDLPLDDAPDDLPPANSPPATTRRERKALYKLDKHRADAYATFTRLEGLESPADVFSSLPRKTMCIINIGFGAVGGATAEQLEHVFSGFAGFERVVMTHGKPYSFVCFRSSDDAQVAYAQVHAKPCAKLNDKVLFLEYLTHLEFAHLAARSAKDPGSGILDESKGLYYIEDFISEEEEQYILDCIRADNGSDDKWFRIQERFVKHYRHSFDYYKKHVGDASLTASPDLPQWFVPFIDRVRQRLPQAPAPFAPDQLTIQRYPAGAGIAFHSDSHTSFDDRVVILSLASPVEMVFRNPSGSTDATHTVDLKPRSLVLMTAEARYGWEHCIRIRRSDLINGRVRPR